MFIKGFKRGRFNLIRLLFKSNVLLIKNIRDTTLLVHNGCKKKKKNKKKIRISISSNSKIYIFFFYLSCICL
jgi:hypothetical protein